MKDTRGRDGGWMHLSTTNNIAWIYHMCMTVAPPMPHSLSTHLHPLQRCVMQT